LADSLEKSIFWKKPGPVRAFRLKGHFGQILMNLSQDSISNPCSQTPDICRACRAFLSECENKELLFIVGSKTLELFLERPSNTKGSGASRTLPLYLFRKGSAFLRTQLVSAVRNGYGAYGGFSFGIAAGARSAFISAPAGDVRLARRILKNLPQPTRVQLAGPNDEQLASRLDEDHGLLLHLLSQVGLASWAEDPWCCEILVIPLSHHRDGLAGGIPLDVLPRPYLRDAAAAYAFEGLPPRPYADRTASHVLNMLYDEAPSFRIATTEEIVPMETLIRKFLGEFRDDFDGIPLIFEPHQHRPSGDHVDTLFYSPAAPTVLGPIQQPRIYGQFFEDLHVRFERLGKAGLMPGWEWNFFSFQQFDSLLGIQVLYPAVNNFAGSGLDKFLSCVRRIAPRVSFEDVVKPTKAGFFSRFIRFSAAKNEWTANHPHPSPKPVAAPAISNIAAKTA
jgi:hypothetical protein